MLSLKIAIRYLFARKSHSAVNVISVISVAGVAVASMAIIVVLSVFNGFHDLAASQLSHIDPELKVIASKGKVIDNADSVAAVLEAMPEIDVATPTLTERALLVGGDEQMPVVFKGVDFDSYSRLSDFEALIIDGVYASSGIEDSVPSLEIAMGPAVKTRLRPSVYPIASVYVPRRTGRINPANPAAAYRSRDFAVSGVFRVDQPEYDSEYIIMPLDEARSLLEYGSGEASAVEIRLAAGVGEDRGVEAVRKALNGLDITVLTRLEQQAESFRMIAVEKWVTFLMLMFILIVASFNIASTLSLMVIEKRDNMATLRALGAPSAMLRRVFVIEGWLITALGGVIGVAVGIVLSLLQEHFGFIKLAGDPSALTITAYPVHVAAGDVAAVLAAIFAVGILIGLISRIFTHKYS